MANEGIFIGIKRLWYRDPITEDIHANKAGAIIKALIEGSGETGIDGYNNGTPIAPAKEVLNIHQDTWNYNQDDPSVTDYINELTGKPYFRDKQNEGNKTISFTMGQFEYQTKADLQGGTVITKGDGASAKAIGWKAPEVMSIIEKCIIALTKSGNYIIFSNASIIGKSDQQQKAIGLGVTAVAQDTLGDGVADEYLFNGDEVALAN